MKKLDGEEEGTGFFSLTKDFVVVKTLNVKEEWESQYSKYVNGVKGVQIWSLWSVTLWIKRVFSREFWWVTYHMLVRIVGWIRGKIMNSSKGKGGKGTKGGLCVYNLSSTSIYLIMCLNNVSAYCICLHTLTLTLTFIVTLFFSLSQMMRWFIMINLIACSANRTKNKCQCIKSSPQIWLSKKNPRLSTETVEDRFSKEDICRNSAIRSSQPTVDDQFPKVGFNTENKVAGHFVFFWLSEMLVSEHWLVLDSFQEDRWSLASQSKNETTVLYMIGLIAYCRYPSDTLPLLYKYLRQRGRQRDTKFAWRLISRETFKGSMGVWMWEVSPTLDRWVGVISEALLSTYCMYHRYCMRLVGVIV